MRPDRGHAPAARASAAPDPSRVLIIGCGALARELVAVVDQAGLVNVDLTCLPATLHNRPGGIPAAVRERIRSARPRYARIFIAYADCGTGGLLDAMLADEGVERLPGAHCYEFYSGSRAFEAMTDEDPATFFLTDFLARNFDRLVIAGLGLDRHPELLPVYFGNYHRLVYLAQTDDQGLLAGARRAAKRLGLAFEVRRTGFGDLATSVVAAAAGTSPARADTRAGFRSGERRAAGASLAARAILAPEANNERVGAAAVPESADSLRRGQETARRPDGRAPQVPPVQERRVTRPASRRCSPPVQTLPPVQPWPPVRPARPLPPVQRDGRVSRGGRVTHATGNTATPTATTAAPGGR